VNYGNAYVAATTYTANDAVTFNGSTYISLQSNNTGNSPAASPTFGRSLLPPAQLDRKVLKA
jgi:hypothetical protein